MALLGEERGSRFSVLEERKELENPIIIKCFAEAKEKIMMHKEVQTVNEKKKEDFAVQTDLNLISSKYDPLLNPTSIDDALSSLTIKQSVRRFSTMSIHRQGSLGKRESVVLNILNTLTVSHPLPHNESITSKDTDSDSDASEEEEVRRGRREEEGRKKEEEGRRRREEGRGMREEGGRRVDEGLLSEICQKLREDDFYVQFECLWILTNLVCLSSEFIQPLMEKFGFLDTAAKLLQSPSEKVRSQVKILKTPSYYFNELFTE